MLSFCAVKEEASQLSKREEREKGKTARTHFQLHIDESWMRFLSGIVSEPPVKESEGQHWSERGEKVREAETNSLKGEESERRGELARYSTSVQVTE